MEEIRVSGIPQRPKPPTQKVRLDLEGTVEKASLRAKAAEERTLDGEDEKERFRVWKASLLGSLLGRLERGRNIMRNMIFV